MLKILHHFRGQDLTSGNIPATCLPPNALKNDPTAVCNGMDKDGLSWQELALLDIRVPKCKARVGINHLIKKFNVEIISFSQNRFPLQLRATKICL